MCSDDPSTLRSRIMRLTLALLVCAMSLVAAVAVALGWKTLDAGLGVGHWGRATAEYLDASMTRITLIGGSGLLLLALVPMILLNTIVDSQAMASFFGGTSLLIIVGVALDTLRIMESHLLVRKYEGFLSHGTLHGRGGV